MHEDFSYYDLLDVSASASTDEIKTAYRAAVLKYHPDVNSAPNAQRLTEILNEAYAVLSDPVQRRNYDAAMASGSATAEPGEQSKEEWDLYYCDNCKKLDIHLRLALFYNVWSIIFYSRMKPQGGILCPGCRSSIAISSALFSAFLGPWGFPWGFLYTVRALFASIRGGEQPRQQNAQLLRHQGIAFLQRGFINEARTALVNSLRFEKNEAVISLLDKPAFSISTVIPGPRWLGGQTVAAFLFVVPTILIILVLNSLDAPRASEQPSQQALAQQRSDDTVIKSLIAQCRNSTSPQAAYDACDRTITWFQDDENKLTVGTSDYQEYAILVDNARLLKGLAALKLQRTAEARQLLAQSGTDLRSLETSGATPYIRTISKKYYDGWLGSSSDKKGQ